jgi:four helix bundle protein
MTNKVPISKVKNAQKFDLEDRTTKFGKNIIQFAKKVPKTIVTTPLISQLVRAGTSVGANYREADDAESRTDFRHKIAICKKEARETKYWLEMVVEAVPQMEAGAEHLIREAKELNLIFNAIINSLKRNV